jgi:hypothetical protein
MQTDEYAALVADVAAHGIVDPIMVYDGQILDGRHRYQAAGEAGVECPQTEFEGDDRAAAAFVISCNAHRRHLMPAQKAAAVRAVEAASRRLAGLPDIAPEPLPPGPKSERSANGFQSPRDVGKMAAVSHPTVAAVDAVARLAVEAEVMPDHETAYRELANGTSAKDLKHEAEHHLAVREFPNLNAYPPAEAIKTAAALRAMPEGERDKRHAQAKTGHRVHDHEAAIRPLTAALDTAKTMARRLDALAESGALESAYESELWIAKKELAEVAARCRRAGNHIANRQKESAR